MLTKKPLLSIILFLSILSSIPVILVLGSTTAETNINTAINLAARGGEASSHAPVLHAGCDTRNYTSILVKGSREAQITVVLGRGEELLVLDKTLSSRLGLDNNPRIEICAGSKCMNVSLIVEERLPDGVFPGILYVRDYTIPGSTGVEVCGVRRDNSVLVSLIGGNLADNIGLFETPVTLALSPAAVSAGLISSRELCRELVILENIGARFKRISYDSAVVLLLVFPFYLFQAASIGLLVFNVARWVTGYISGMPLKAPPPGSWVQSTPWIVLLYVLYSASLVLGLRRFRDESC